MTSIIHSLVCAEHLLCHCVEHSLKGHRGSKAVGVVQERHARGWAQSREQKKTR